MDATGQKGIFGRREFLRGVAALAGGAALAACVPVGFGERVAVATEIKGHPWGVFLVVYHHQHPWRSYSVWSGLADYSKPPSFTVTTDKDMSYEQVSILKRNFAQ